MQTATEQAVDPQERDTLILVDASGYIFRAFHALPPLTRPDGTPVGAVYGYIGMLTKTLDALHATHVGVIFDAARHNFRNEIYPDYKANRGETPEELIPQFPLVREATAALNLPCIEMENYEADDLIAAYAKEGVKQGMEVVILSSDKDLMQLINDDVSMYDPMKQKHMGHDAVIDKFGVPPEKVIEVQALIGDSIDNVPGVPGIGPKTAALLIEEYGDLEGVLQNADQIKQNKRRESLIEFADQARISYELVQLNTSMDLPTPIADLTRKDADPKTLLGFLKEQNFKALTKKMEEKFGEKAPEIEGETPALHIATPEKTEYSVVKDIATLKDWVAQAHKQGYVAIDTETTSLNAMQAELVGISLSLVAGEACYIPLNHKTQIEVKAEQTSLFGDEGEASSEWKRLDDQLGVEEVLEVLRPMLKDPSVLKIGQNIKYDMLVLSNYDTELTPIDDTMLLSYVTAGGLHNHNMDELSERHLGIKPIAFKEVVGTGKSQLNFSQVALDKACDYAAEDADITLRLHQILKHQLTEDKLAYVYERIERPLVDVIVDMERQGIKASPEFLKNLSDEFEKDLGVLEKEIYDLAGREFTIGSPKQLGEILFDELGLEGGKKSSKSGAYATGAEILEELAANGHMLPERVLSWRQLSKLKSTYTDSLIKQIHPETGRIHTSFSMAAASTGRLSSSDPNLQNIPIRTEAGKRIREAFIAEEGCKLVSADYSQIELRLLAHIAEIDVLKQAFKEGADIHAATASQMFGQPIDQIDSELRRKAKTINFGIIYGISAHGLATRLGIGRGEAKEYIDAYFEQYPGIRKYMERTKEYAREHGYVKTEYGRKVHVKDINAKNPNLRAFSERAAINAPLQGTAADIIKKAMVDVHQILAEKHPKARLLLQVHDELIVECPEAEAEAVAESLRKTMSSAAHLSVPLLVEYGIGDNWGEIH
ncbi:MAG: DNA polymerase I [Rickettsiales bacterium]|nr:DNA polymerase I [Rickettsiales bacterium]